MSETVETTKLQFGPSREICSYTYIDEIKKYFSENNDKNTPSHPRVTPAASKIQVQHAHLYYNRLIKFFRMFLVTALNCSTLSAGKPRAVMGPGKGLLFSPPPPSDTAMNAQTHTATTS